MLIRYALAPCVFGKKYRGYESVPGKDYICRVEVRQFLGKDYLMDIKYITPDTGSFESK